MKKHVGAAFAILGFCISLNSIVMAVDIVYTAATYKLNPYEWVAAKGSVVLKEMDGTVIARKEFATEYGGGQQNTSDEMRFKNVGEVPKLYHAEAHTSDGLCKGSVDGIIESTGTTNQHIKIHDNIELKCN